MNFGLRTRRVLEKKTFYGNNNRRKAIKTIMSITPH